MPDQAQPRTFKTAWFSKAARKALIADKALCDAIEQVRKGQCDDLGGGVFKKRLDKNRQRSIILAKGKRCWSIPTCSPRRIATYHRCRAERLS
ncbi:MAG: type II toxin-antitoxin system RelE/ParE family toxin [Janthinobacterium lividum]